MMLKTEEGEEKKRKRGRGKGVFNDRPDLVKSLIYGTKKVSAIAKELGVTVSYVSQYKKKIMEQQQLKNPIQAELKERNRAYVRALLEEDTINLSDFKKTMQDLIAETTFIVQEINSADEEKWTPLWVNTKLKAIERLEKLILTYIKEFGALNEVRNTAEVENLKDRIEKVIDFLQEKSPGLIPEFVRYLEKRESEFPGMDEEETEN